MLKPVPELIKEVAANVRRIDADTAANELTQNNGLLIDVREPGEFQTKAVNGAVNFPRGLLEMKTLEMEKDANRPIYLHCATAARATLGAEQLQRIGYTQVAVITSDLDAIQSAFKE